MGEKRYPALLIDREKFRENVQKICDLCMQSGIVVAGVIKGFNGMIELAEDFVAGGAKCLASSRIEQLEDCKNAGIDVPLMMIRVPMLSEVADVVRVADYSLNSELSVLIALNDEALKQGKVHKVVLMVDLGDLREGWIDEVELVKVAKLVETEFDGLELAGIGTNLGCYGSVIPTRKKMLELASIARQIEKAIGRSLEIISGGATSSLMPVFDGAMPGKINMLRIGEAALTGSRCDLKAAYGRNEVDVLNGDVFVLEAEVIEVKRKPTYPIGELGVDSTGKPGTYEDRGKRRHALLAVGRADYMDPSYITPVNPAIKVLGASSDHTIIDIEDLWEPLEVGDIVKLYLHYGGVLGATGSRNVKKYFVERSDETEDGR